jgi:hypothetical protein
MENEQLISGKAYIKIHNFRLTPKRAENLYNALHKALRHPIPLVIKSEKDQVFAVLKKEEFPTNVFKSLEIYWGYGGETKGDETKIRKLWRNPSHISSVESNNFRNFPRSGMGNKNKIK